MLLSLTGEKKRRVQRMRSSLVESRPGICPQRAQIYTRAYQQFENQPPTLKRARALRLYEVQGGLWQPITDYIEATLP